MIKGNNKNVTMSTDVRHGVPTSSMLLVIIMLMNLEHHSVLGFVVGPKFNFHTGSAPRGEGFLQPSLFGQASSIHNWSPLSAYAPPVIQVSQKSVISMRPPETATTATRLCMWSRDDDEIIGFGNRIRCCFPYLLPLIDGDHFGRYIYERIPPLGLANEVLLAPLVQINHNVPFFGLAFFLAMTLGTRFNFDLDRSVRYNAQLAALVDIALIFPELIANGFEEGDLPRSLAEPCSNFVWYVYTTAVVYCVYSNLRGKKPNGIPYLSDSAEWMVGPF